MKKSTVGIIVGILIGIIISGGGIAVAAGIMAETALFQVSVDGNNIDAKAYVIEGRTYLQMRDIAKALDVGFWWDETNRVARIESNMKYDPNYKGSGTTTPSTTGELGTRMNPVPFGQSFTTEYTQFTYNHQVIGYKIQIVDLLRGDEAAKMALQANPYNDVPEGRELVLFKVKFTLNKYTYDNYDDKAYYCSSIWFDYFNSDYSEINTFVSVAGLDNLSAELYDGGSTEGWLYTTADPNDPYPLARFDDRVWLALYKG